MASGWSPRCSAGVFESTNVGNMSYIFPTFGFPHLFGVFGCRKDVGIFSYTFPTVGFVFPTPSFSIVDIVLYLCALKLHVLAGVVNLSALLSRFRDVAA